MTWFRILTLVLGMVMVAKASYMDIKAQVAQILIDKAWHAKVDYQPASEAWPWADSRAIAKIEVPRLAITQFVMSDASGESLAFGPGHLTQTSLPASSGHSMVAGHRDSHFDFVQLLKIGDEIRITNFLGENQTYVVVNARKMDTRTEYLQLHEDDLLTLITCYPFDELVPGGPLRWLVNAVPQKKTLLAKG